MLIEIIDHRAPEALLKQLEQGLRGGNGWGALYFACQALSPSIRNSLPLALQPILEGRKSRLYFFDDGNVLVTFSTPQKTVITTLADTFYTHTKLPNTPELHKYLDFQANGEELRVLCKNKTAHNSAIGSYILTPMITTSGISANSTNPVVIDPQQKALFKSAVEQREKRKGLEILIVEDQEFSAKLLTSLLRHLCSHFDTRNAEEAWKVYLRHAPNIVFLDVELPGVNGHQLAAAIHALDPDAFIIMVTANHEEKDVSRAKENGARGFIVKPYSKRKILEGIEKYIHEHKAKP